MTPAVILSFWFQKSDNWFTHSAEFDHIIRTQFYDIWLQASRCELAVWRDTLRGRLAEIIVLDQFSRHLFRDDARAYAQDNLALILAQEAIIQNGFFSLSPIERQFILMPMMHSESRVIHEEAAELFRRHTKREAYQLELKHKAIIDQFGRYPQRNRILQRHNTPEEEQFLLQLDS